MFNLTSVEISHVELYLKILGGVGAFTIFIIGLMRYWKDQSWKKMEFVASTMKEFNANSMVNNCLLMLDWGARYIELFPGKEKYDERFAKVDRDILTKALQYHEHRPKDSVNDFKFDRIEVAIRDNFDTFLSYFETFHHYVEAKLIDEKELRPYLKYWIKSIAEKLELNVRESLYNYIDKYEYAGTQNLFRMFGYEVVPIQQPDQTECETK